MSKVTEFGKAIRKKRIDLDISLRTMAENIGISASYLSLIETGGRDVDYDLVALIANEIGITELGEFFELYRTALKSNKKITISTCDYSDKDLDLILNCVLQGKN